MVAGRVDVLTGTRAIELDWLKGNKFHEGIGQALHYGDVTGQHGLFIKSVAICRLMNSCSEEARWVL